MLNLIKLENRIVLDGAAVGNVLDHAAEHDALGSDAGQVPDHADDAADRAEHIADAAALLAESAASVQPVDIIVVADDLPDYQTLVDAADPDAHVIVYDADAESAEDVISRVTAEAEESGQQIGSLTILSHGGPGYFNLGSEKITTETLTDHSEAWAALDSAMTDDARIYVYGCNVSTDSGTGQSLINGLAKATGADVFSSDDITGVGGDWDLESGSDGADTDHITSPLDVDHLADYAGNLTTISVPTAIVSLEDQPGTFGIFIYGTDVNATTQNASSVTLVSGDTIFTNVSVRYEGYITDTPRTIDGQLVTEYHRWAVDYDAVNHAFTNDGTYNGASTLTFNVGGTTYTTNVTLLSVNDAPDFTKGPDITVKEDSGSQTFTNWATNLTVGPANESTQNLKFEIVDNSNPDLFDVLPSISPTNYSSLANATGTLTFTAKDNAYGEAIIKVLVQDDGGTANGGVATSVIREFKITVTPENDAPDAPQVKPVEYVENTDPVHLDVTLGNDPDDTQMSKAEIQITDGYKAGEDVLNYTTLNGIAGSWNAATGTLTLTGNATIAQYQEAINSITYGNPANDDPTEGNRTLVVSITDANSSNAPNGAQTSVGTGVLFVDAINDAPQLTPVTGTFQYNENDGARAIASDFVLTDVDDNNMTGAVVQITGNYQAGQDVLGFTNANGITGSWNAATGTLTLTGLATKEAYQAALRSVTYDNSSESPNGSQRTVTFTVTDENSRGLGYRQGNTAIGGPMDAVARRTVAVTNVPDPPLKPVVNPLTPINEDNDDPYSIPREDDSYKNLPNNGNTVAEIVVSIEDADLPNKVGLESIAITELDNSNGQWQYSLDGGTTWKNIRDSNDGEPVKVEDDVRPEDADYNPDNFETVILKESEALVLDSSAKVRFLPGENFNTQRPVDNTIPSFIVRAWDQSEINGPESGDKVVITNPGVSGSPYSAETAEVGIIVNAVNDAPVLNNMPSEKEINGQGVLTVEGVTLSDVDVNEGTGLATVTLSVENGTIKISESDTRADTTLQITGNDTTSITVTGTLAEINAAISTISYKANEATLKDFIAAGNMDDTFDTMTVTGKDKGNFGLPGERDTTGEISIKVGNRPPVIDLDPDPDNGGDPPVGPPSPDNTDPDNRDFNVYFIEDSKCTPVYIADINDPAPLVTEPDNENIIWMEVRLTNPQASDVLAASVEGTNIKIETNGLDEKGQLVLKFSGSDIAANYDKVLKTVTFDNSSENPDATRRIIQVTASDINGNEGQVATSRVSVVPVNDAPVNHVPGSVSAAVNTAINFGNQLSVSDVDVAGGMLQVKLQAEHGTITLTSGDTGATIQNLTEAGKSTVYIVGTEAQVNAALSGLTYTPNDNFTGDDTLTMTTNDLGNTGINSGWVVGENGLCVVRDNGENGTPDGPLDPNGNVIPPPNAGTPEDPTANIVTSIIPIKVIDNHPHIDVTPPPTPPGPPILPITRPDHEEMGGITLEAVRLPGPVGITIGGPDTRAGIPAGGEKCFEFCSLEDALRSHLGCRFANTRFAEAKFSSVGWGDMVDMGWGVLPHINENGEKEWLAPHIDEEYDFYSRLFLREEGDPGLNVPAQTFNFDLGGVPDHVNRLFREGGGEGFNDIGAGELKETFFAGRKQLDKLGRGPEPREVPCEPGNGRG